MSIIEVEYAEDVAAQPSGDLLIDAAVRARQDRAFRRRVELRLLHTRRGRLGFRLLGWMVERSRGRRHVDRPFWPAEDVIRELHTRQVANATGSDR